MGLKEVLVGAARAGDSDGVGGEGRPGPAWGAVRRIAEELGIHPEALRTWVRQAEIDRGDRPGTTTDEARRIKEPALEVRELRRANEILRKASAYLRPGRSVSAAGGHRLVHR